MILVKISIKGTVETIPDDVLSNILGHLEPASINVLLLTDVSDKIKHSISDNLARYWMRRLEEVSQEKLVTNPAAGKEPAT